MNKEAGLTFIEILIVIGILGILAALVLTGISGQQKKARDVHIKSAMNQLRVTAEIAYDNSGASYKDWTTDATLTSSITTILEEVDRQYNDTAGAPYVTVTRESQTADFCVSAPLRADPGSYTCIDATGELRTTTAECPDHSEFGSQLLCP